MKVAARALVNDFEWSRFPARELFEPLAANQAGPACILAVGFFRFCSPLNGDLHALLPLAIQ
jgi:hypothetical protein